MANRKFIQVTWIPRKQMVAALIQLGWALGPATISILLITLLASCSVTPPYEDLGSQQSQIQ